MTSAGVLLAFGGVVVLAAGPVRKCPADPAVVGAAFAFAVANVLTKRHGPFDPLMLMGWSSFFTVPQVIWFWLIARCTIARVAPFALLLPVIALISSVLFLGDRMTPALAIGALLAISGVAVTQVRPIARPNST
jgi:O-acetylserine/cysteine efflux transporter